MAKQLKPETLCVQAGWTPKKGEPRVLPIYQSTTFKYETSEQMARLFDLEENGYFYTRPPNPTKDGGKRRQDSRPRRWCGRHADIQRTICQLLRYF